MSRATRFNAWNGEVDDIPKRSVVSYRPGLFTGKERPEKISWTDIPAEVRRVAQDRPGGFSNAAEPCFDGVVARGVPNAGAGRESMPLAAAHMTPVVQRLRWLALQGVDGVQDIGLRGGHGRGQSSTGTNSAGSSTRIVHPPL